MKKYIRNILLFFIVMAMVDIVFGIVCQYMNDHSKGGGVKSRHYICKETNEDILVFGSSRAKSHYVPDIIEDGLGMTCYNTGEDGNGVILSYGYLKMITERYAPKLIIYDVYRFDTDEDDNVKYVNLLKPYYYEPGIDSIFWYVEPETRIMMCSNMYRFNTTWIRLFGDYVHPLTYYSKGYLGMNKTMDYEPEIKEEKITVDNVKLHYFEKFIQLTQSKDITLLCVVSPTYNQMLGKQFEPIELICKQYGVPFLDFSSFPETSHNKNYFADAIHLNDEGAKLYTKRLVSRIKQFY